MNWYLAKIIYQVISGSGLHAPQFDEQFRLIKADELDWAWEKAQVVGRMGETIFQNDKAQDVHWKFIAVEDVNPINELEDGSQVYAKTEEPENMEEYIQLTKAKAKRLYANRENILLV
jgi:hypothetical protein